MRLRAPASLRRCLRQDSGAQGTAGLIRALKIGSVSQRELSGCPSGLPGRGPATLPAGMNGIPAKIVHLWTRKTERNYVMTPTLTQSGLLAVLLQRQRYKVIQLAQRGAHRKHVRAAVWSILTWPNRRTPHLNLSPKPIAMSPKIRRQQIHDNLRIQHPEWVEPNGESSMCLLEELDALTRRGSNESIAAPHSALEQGLNRIDTVAV